jgi:hypothetical protein
MARRERGGWVEEHATTNPKNWLLLQSIGKPGLYRRIVGMVYLQANKYYNYSLDLPTDPFTTLPTLKSIF